MKQRNSLQVQQADDAAQTAKAQNPAESEFKMRVNVFRSKDRAAPYSVIEARAVAGVRATADPNFEPRRPRSTTV